LLSPPLPPQTPLATLLLLLATLLQLLASPAALVPLVEGRPNSRRVRHVRGWTRLGSGSDTDRGGG